MSFQPRIHICTKELILGAVLGISRGHGGYIITQPHSPKGGSGSNLRAPPANVSKNRYALSASLGPVTVSLYSLSVWFVQLAKLSIFNDTARRLRRYRFA